MILCFGRIVGKSSKDNSPCRFVTTMGHWHLYCKFYHSAIYFYMVYRGYGLSLKEGINAKVNSLFEMMEEIAMPMYLKRDSIRFLEANVSAISLAVISIGLSQRYEFR